ncbi:MAG: hypothetical protein K6B41_04830 [Butyrivibrio sp.]|nr:hypothetical protein [Butyrivibrio sp.]
MNNNLKGKDEEKTFVYDRDNPENNKYKEDKRVKILCWTALICWILGHLTLFNSSWLESIVTAPYDKSIVPIAGMLFVVGLVLAIVVRVTSPKNKFAKVLVNTFIVEMIIVVALFIIFLISCELALRSCESDCIGCLEMG